MKTRPNILSLLLCLIVITNIPTHLQAQVIPGTSAPTTLRPSDSSVKKAPAPPILDNYRNREVDTQLVVETITDTVLVTLIDNGTIDGDTISLIVNGKVAHGNVGINANLKHFWIGMVKGQRNQIIMYAENLGKMPPNTALMRIYHSGKTEWIYASSDYNKSFGVILEHRILNLFPYFGSKPEEKVKTSTSASLLN
ncbi:MAG: hypothetical protein EOO04_07390 [Chitinophagaceae bacterium]|nr:MAG: hypothetical protein EOO04_07390 [Chitinophagaceae bacterium]